MTSQVSPLWDSLPEELRWMPSWCIAGPDKAPYLLTTHGPVNASVQNPKTWTDFETAADGALALGGGVGYVLSAADPYTCIDLDVKDASNEPDAAKWTTQEQLDRFWRIVGAFDSYTEKSRSGRGLHIWVRGNIGTGCKRDGVEVYSQERFIISTGNVLFNKPIEARQEMLDILVAEIRRGGNAPLQLVELEETEDDYTIVDRAMNAANGDKFTALCQGDWHGLGFPSQSEADLALMSMFTFYSKSNEQCRRLFRLTELGKREKAVKDNRYLDLTLKQIRARQANDNKIGEFAEASARALVEEMQNKLRSAQTIPHPDSSIIQAAIEHNEPPPAPEHGLSWPPGITGAIAAYIYNSSPRPVREVSIVAALGFLAGVCGKAWLIPQSGLNLYIILVARSAIGKEAMHSGIGNILAEMRESVPDAHRFVDFNDFASGPALVKACANNTSFVNVAGEWGRKLKGLSLEAGANASVQQLRTVMTNLFQKSGPSSIVGGLSYSNQEQNIASVNGVAFSMIGETTPGTLYDSLTDSMMEDGFLSRFTIVEYVGERPPLNLHTVKKMDLNLKQAIEGLASQAQLLLGRFQHCPVEFSPEAWQTLTDFDKECDAQINSTADESWRQMWNRAHLKSLRISALLAVADNYVTPVVMPVHAAWALELIRRDIQIMSRRVSNGDVGSGDHARELKLLSLIKDYLQSGASPGYNIPIEMQREGIVPRKLLQLRCARVTNFSTHRMGANAAMDSTLKALIDNGYIVEVDRAKLVTTYKFHGKCYRVISLPPYAK